MIVTAFALGIIIGFLFFEITGLTAGGVIVPGYIALFASEPVRILVTLALSLVAYSLVTLLARFTILFGRRRFLLMVLTGFTLRLLWDQIGILLPEHSMDLQAIGYIIPGLIANEYARQGVAKTIASLIIVSVIVYFLLQLFFR